MSKKLKIKPSSFIRNIFLLFWMLSSLFVGTFIGYEAAINNGFLTGFDNSRRITTDNDSPELTILTAENVELCFTPPKGCAAVIVRAILKAKRSIYVQAYGMTSPSIVNALINAQRRGIKIRILLDKSNIKDKWSKMDSLIESGADVGIDKVSGIAHNKVMIIDKSRVITGSFNFTKSADTRNAENVIIINDANVAEQYLQNWLKRKAKNELSRG
jgi:phospholipase D